VGFNGLESGDLQRMQTNAQSDSAQGEKVTWTLPEAIDLCKKIEMISPEFGCHVALTGGVLYKEGHRKDLDILFYRIRNVETINVNGLVDELKNLGLTDFTGFGWCRKAKFKDKKIDMLFPEEQPGEYTREAEANENF
jgi:hypothetical protein